MNKRLAIVAVSTNLVGRTAIPKEHDPASALNTRWPFVGTQGITDTEAEIVACYVGDLHEGGALKYVLRGATTGRLRECYDHAFNVTS